MDNTCGYLNVSLIAIPAGMSSWETPIGSNSFSGFSVFNSLSPIWGRTFFVGNMMEVIENPDYQNDDRIALNADAPFTKKQEK